MKTKLGISALFVAAAVFGPSSVHSQSPVKYVGCIPGDPLTCSTVTMSPAPDGYWWLTFPVTLGSVAHPGWNYHLYDITWGYSTPDLSCSGSGYWLYLVAGDCGIVNRYRINWHTVALTTKGGPEIVEGIPVTFTAVAPEPTTMSLIALGLAASGVVHRRRRRKRVQG